MAFLIVLVVILKTFTKVLTVVQALMTNNPILKKTYKKLEKKSALKQRIFSW